MTPVINSSEIDNPTNTTIICLVDYFGKKPLAHKPYPFSHRGRWSLFTECTDVICYILLCISFY